MSNTPCIWKLCSEGLVKVPGILVPLLQRGAGSFNVGKPCVYVHMCIYICCICTYIHTYIHIYTCIFFSFYIILDRYIYIYIDICTRICTEGPATQVLVRPPWHCDHPWFFREPKEHCVTTSIIANVAQVQGTGVLDSLEMRTCLLDA